MHQLGQLGQLVGCQSRHRLTQLAQLTQLTLLRGRGRVSPPTDPTDPTGADNDRSPAQVGERLTQLTPSGASDDGPRLRRLSDVTTL